MTLDIKYLQSWIGHSVTIEDCATLTPLRALTAVLDRDDPPALGEAIPTCWHWLYFLSSTRQSELSSDGHAQRGGFLPPVPLPRRMWAGSRIENRAPVCAGQQLQKISRIADVTLKEGRTGSLVFVTVRHEITADGRLAIVDEQHIVYRDMPAADAPAPTYKAAPVNADWSRLIEPDPVLLFRYSALTFNGHRIHYDRRYVTEVEGYPGLVVHGPLIATLLLDLLRRQRPQAHVRKFRFRAIKPLFDTAAFDVCGRMMGANSAELWTRDADGDMTMQATATLA